MKSSTQNHLREGKKLFNNKLDYRLIAAEVIKWNPDNATGNTFATMVTKSRDIGVPALSRDFNIFVYLRLSWVQWNMYVAKM